MIISLVRLNFALRKTLMYKAAVIFLHLLISSPLYAEYLNIGIMEHYGIRRFTFLTEKGFYQVFADNNIVASLPEGEFLIIVYKEGKIEVKSPKVNIGTFEKLYIIGREVENVFRITPIEPDKNSRSYDDNLRVTIRTNSMRLVNNVEIENYIAGVVQAEVGPTPAPEFFKLQSILCRTYALENRNKHEFDGYNLCDRVHCQAYHKKCSDAEIEKASLSTSGLVIVDSEINLITAAFYSNCGGQTVNSEDVWQKPVYYLRSVKDPHCVREPNAAWSMKVEKTEWMQYISRKSPGNGISDTSELQPFYQKERASHYVCGDVRLPLKTIRSDLKLKSTYFDAVPIGGHILLTGKGFGHGAGLCQEGAMRMAASGFSYPEILHFYYKDVHLVDISALDFFKEE